MEDLVSQGHPNGLQPGAPQGSTGAGGTPGGAPGRIGAVSYRHLRPMCVWF